MYNLQCIFDKDTLVHVVVIRLFLNHLRNKHITEYQDIKTLLISIILHQNCKPVMTAINNLFKNCAEINTILRYYYRNIYHKNELKGKFLKG